MDFGLTDEQELILATVRDFTNRELLPHEDEVERRGHVPAELADGIRKKAIEAGIFAANMPVEVGGAGLDNLTMALGGEGTGQGVLCPSPPGGPALQHPVGLRRAPARPVPLSHRGWASAWRRWR